MATLTRVGPFRDLDIVERRMRRLLEDAGIAPAPLPAANLYETDGELVVELDVPGFEESELSLEISDHTLKVTGERTKEKEAKDKTFHLQERLERTFTRAFTLPPEADLDGAKAQFERGVLEVHVPKAEPSKARTIEIGH